MISLIKIMLVMVSVSSLFSRNAFGDRQQAIDKMRQVNQIYQVYLGRSAFPRELRASLVRSPREVADELIQQKEFQDLFACRVYSFVHGGQLVENKNCPTLANADSALEKVLEPLTRKDHSTCRNEPASVCFGLWLVERVAPLQKDGFINKIRSRLPAASYAELLSFIING